MSWTDEQIKELTSIDQELGLSYCAESREVYIEMLEIYLEQGEENLERLPAFVEQKDWKNYIVAVHGLKGTSLTIGLQAFSEKSKEQEFAGKEERYDFIVDGLDDFLDLYRKVLAVVQNIVDNE